MENSGEFDFEDMQGLLRFGHGHLTDSCFLLLNIVDADAAKQWLKSAPVSSATKTNTRPGTALQIAFSVDGLRALGLKESVIEDFSDEFISGMAGDESRSRRLGDIGANAPEHWDWGGDATQVAHVLLLLYAQEGEIEAWRKTVENEQFSRAFQLLRQLPTQPIGKIEPFGFNDAISQPAIDWARQQSAGSPQRDRYSNWLAAGEVTLGYPNEYGQYTARPLIDPKNDGFAAELLNAEDQPALKDFGRNGSYLVLRQLAQDVPGFWQFLDKVTGSAPEQREQLAAAMVGRKRDGSPLIPLTAQSIPGILSADHDHNHFTYDLDPGGNHCPIGAHIRRTNPRTGDLPPYSPGLISRLKKVLGFGQAHPNEDVIASARFHRILRRGRAYGPVLTPEEAVKPDAPAAERGLQFICLVANISRQFEFIQNAWVRNSKFGGVHQESDPLLGHRQPLESGERIDQFNRPDPAGPMRKTCHLPEFISVRGGGYFFMPGRHALNYIAVLPNNNEAKHAS
ncbi:MAG: peroxidase [Chloroflexi bacterium]|nr:peroxidase [Chloroflexota bacterium]